MLLRKCKKARNFEAKSSFLGHLKHCIAVHWLAWHIAIRVQILKVKTDIFPEQQLMFKSLQFSLDIPDGLEISRVESNYMNIEAEHYHLISLMINLKDVMFLLDSH